MDTNNNHEYTSLRIDKSLKGIMDAHAKKYYPYGLSSNSIIKLLLEDSQKYQEKLLRNDKGQFKKKE